MQPGKVYLVGAGPGHPELLTLKAAELLRTGDVIVYDRLVQEEVLTLSKPSAERIYMGKVAGRHNSRQGEIHELLVRKSHEGKTVVRLKGGDPFLFGRGGEEAEYLAGNGIPFEVVPGVSSALAAPACAGIAVTHRDAASSLAIVTGHEANRESSRINWDALCGIDTLVFLMSVNNVGRIAHELTARGRSPETPAAMIQMAFWHGEQVVCGTLSSIAEDVKQAGIQPPATLVIGDVVRLRERLAVSQRDLFRGAESSASFAPGPAPDQLLRLAIGGLGSQVLQLALDAGLFDRLELWRTVEDVANQVDLNPSAAEEFLDCLVSLGLVERGPEGYRNLELASRYLVGSSPHCLKPVLLYYARLGGGSMTLQNYLFDTRRGETLPSKHDEYESSSECVARFAVPFVMNRIDLAAHSPVLIAGWGCQAYREAVVARWPHLTVDARNPFAAELTADITRTLPAGPFRAILLSGLLASCGRGEVQRVLEAAVAALAEGGILIVQDAFLPDSVVPAPDVMLATLGRHVTRGGCATWSQVRLQRALEDLGMRSVHVHRLPASSLLVLARRS